MKFILLLPLLMLFSACQSPSGKGSKEMPIAKDKIDLGKILFFDPILSEDRSLSCAHCHNPKYAFADNQAISRGIKNTVGTRNAPSVMNMASRSFFFHDGRAESLQAQAIGPIENPVEMNLEFSEAVRRVQKQKHYQRSFLKLYGEMPNESNIPDALAAFESSLESDGSAPHDRWMNGEDDMAMSASAQRGRQLFLSEEMKCFECHFGPDFTQDDFRNIGLFDGVKLKDSGRITVSGQAKDLGAFKVPGLRNVALTAPYMHNGMLATLEEVIDYYSNPYDFVERPINIDPLLQEPLDISPKDKKDLIAFLHSLTDEHIPYEEMSGE